jgi:type VI secretion system secreted protein VgrG
MSDSTFLHQVFFTAEGLAPGVGRVRSLVAHEGLSRCYEIEIEIELALDGFDPAAWIGQPALARVVKSDGTILRRFGGIVTRVRERASVASPSRFTVKLESPLSLLCLLTDHRIFQEQTTKDIVATLLEERGIGADAVEWRLQESYPKREVCTQFGETTFAFVSRLLEEDGIFYFHEHGEAATKIVFGDSSSAYTKTEPADEIPFRTESGLVSESAILEMAELSELRPAKVTLTDHDFKKPALTLESTASSQAPLGREHYDFPGRYVDPNEGKRRAQVRLDAMAAAGTGVRGASSAFSLTPGHTFKPIEMNDSTLDKEWVVRDIEHVWDDTPSRASSYENRFSALAKDTVFRPPASAPEADVPGPQLAIVTGPAGEEIHTDEFGRVKVRFPWDRRGTTDDKSSSWVRVAQMHSSGSVAIPRVGWEVLVDFEGGDPDRPIVLGRLYNGKYTPPYQLPASKTQSALQSSSTPGGGGQNEIRMEDGSGGEHIHVRAQKDMNVAVANNKTEKVTTSATLGVGSNHTSTIGANSTLKVGAQDELEVGGAQTLAIGAARSETLSGDEKIDVKGSRTLTIGAGHTTMTPMAVSASTPASFSETVGGSAIEAAALGVGMAVAGTASITVGGAVIAACATGATSLTVGAQASTVGGAFISASGKDVGMTVGGAKATTVGGAWVVNAGADVLISTKSTLNITVGGALAFTGASSVVLKVGGSTVTLSGGAVAIKSSTIKLIATGPQPELAPMVEDK